MAADSSFIPIDQLKVGMSVLIFNTTKKCLEKDIVTQVFSEYVDEQAKM